MPACWQGLQHHLPKAVCAVLEDCRKAGRSLKGVGQDILEYSRPNSGPENFEKFLQMLAMLEGGLG